MKQLIALILFLLVLIADAQTANYRGESNKFEPGIGILVSTFPDTSNYLNNIFIVNDRGEIDLPIVGRISVKNMSEEELKDYLKNTFKNYLRINFLRIEILYRVSLLGGFEDPGLYMVKPDETLWSVIRRAGGFQDDKGFKKMKVYRGSDEININLTDGYSKGMTLRELGIKNGDVITTPIPREGTDSFTRLTQFLSIIATSAAVYFAYISTVVNARRAR